MKIGDVAQQEHWVTPEAVMKFAEVSTDFNPLHVDPNAAKRSRFGRPVAHGALVMSYISALLGQNLPGPGTIYLSQSVRFKSPVYVGDTVRVQVSVESIRPSGVITLRHAAYVGERLVLDGESVVLYEEPSPATH